MPFDDIGRVAPAGRLAAYMATNFEMFVPDIHHISEHVVLLSDGSLLAMMQMPNHPFQLEEMKVRNNRRAQLSQLYKSVADNNVTIATHLCHLPTQPAPISRSFETPFVGEMFETYRQNCLVDKAYANSWFLTVIVSPRFTPARTLHRMFSRKKATAEASPSLVRQLAAIMQPIMAAVAQEGGRRLGYRDNGRYSAIAEARSMCLYGRWKPVLACDAPLGAMIYNERITCGARAIRIHGFDGPRYAKVVAFNRYPSGDSGTRTGQMAHVLDLKCTFVMAQAMRFASRSASETSIYFRQTHLTNAGVQLRAAASLSDAAEDVQGGDVVRGDHNFALIVHAPTIEELDHAAGLAAGAVDRAGASPIVDEGNAFAAFWSALPGNPEWMQARAGDIRSDNFSGLSEYNGYPAGRSDGSWGRSLVEVKTSADTLFGWQPLVGLVGHSLFLGKTRSGKTLLMNFLLMALEQVPVRVFYFDFDHCAEPMVRSSSGSYLPIRGAGQSGLAPLRALENTPEVRAFLQVWIAALMQLDGRGELKNETVSRLARGIARVMKLPPSLRRFGGLRAFLGFEEGGDGERLDVWCHDGSQGWLFDGEKDEVSLDCRVVAWDMTQILKHYAIPAVATYLLFRIRPVIDGSPVVVAIPEVRYYLTRPLFAAIVEDFSLGLAKKNGALWLDTQEPQHLLDTSVGASLVSQCGSVYQFPTRTADYDTYTKRLGFSPAMVKAITETMATLPSRTVLLRREDESVILNVDLTDMADDIAVLSGTEETVRLIPAIVETVGVNDGPAFHREFVRRVRALNAARRRA